jgi:DNA-binding FadR family transcriptional regulator
MSEILMPAQESVPGNMLVRMQESLYVGDAGDNLPVTPNLGRKPLFQEIQQRIRSFIFDKGLKPGEMLPPAAEMASFLGVSAASLREGLRAMEALGMLETRHGIGTFVCGYNLTPIFESLSFSLFFDNKGLYKLIQIRKAIEVGLVHDVVPVIQEADLQTLDEMCVQSQATGWSAALDMRFHRLIYECLNNELIGHILDIYWMTSAKLVDPTAFTRFQRKFDWHIHRRIVDALQARDAEAAVAALQFHFVRAASRLHADSQ